jgi:hypothetical protein
VHTPLSILPVKGERDDPTRAMLLRTSTKQRLILAELGWTQYPVAGKS